MEINAIRSKIDSTILSHPDFHRGPEIRFSGAGDCVLKIVRDHLDGKGETAIDGALRMEMGTPLHEWWQDILQKSFPDDFALHEFEVQVTVRGQTILGHFDGFLNSIKAVVEIKTVSESTFYLVKNAMKPLAPHLEQTNAYAGAFSNVRETPVENLLFLYQNRNTGEYLMLIEPYNPDAYQATLTKWDQAIQAIGMKVYPVRPYNDATCSPCWFCSHKERCYEGYAEQVAAMGAKEVDDQEILTHSKAYSVARSEKLRFEKLEDVEKTNVAAWMLDANLNEIKTPEGKITLKVGKNNSPLISIKAAK